MQILHASRQQLDIQAYRMRSAKESDFSRLITEDTIIKEGDTVKVAYIKLSDPRLDLLDAALDRIRYDVGHRTSGMKTTTRIFGYSPRIAMRNDYCRVSSLAVEQPREHADVAAGSAVVSEYYARCNEALWNAHTAQTAERIQGDYTLPGGAFTSGIINKNNPLLYHFDTGNFKRVWSAMLVFKRDVEGGYLSIPEYDMGFELCDRSLFLFDGQGLLHGVTPITKRTPNARRYSVVYYSMHQLWQCLPIKQEIKEARKRRTAREDKKRQRTDDH